MAAPINFSLIQPTMPWRVPAAFAGFSVDCVVGVCQRPGRAHLIVRCRFRTRHHTGARVGSLCATSGDPGLTDTTRQANYRGPRCPTREAITREGAATRTVSVAVAAG